MPRYKNQLRHISLYELSPYNNVTENWWKPISRLGRKRSRMDYKIKKKVLGRMYEIYDEFVSTLDLDCKKHCDHCCTSNVTMTTLEGMMIVDHLDMDGFLEMEKKIRANSDSKRFSPKITINQLADICAKDGDPPEETIDPDAGPCPILLDKACPIYSVRPFGCRCMVSKKDCGQTGFADMDDFVLTVNDVFMQYIEHIDAQGYTGNFTDIMGHLENDENRFAYMAGHPGEKNTALIPNQPVFVLMVPPEHRERLKPLLDSIQNIKV